MHHDDPVMEKWDIDIQPGHDHVGFRIKEVWQYRDLILLFIKRDFAAQYKQTVLGPIWHVVQPILTTVIFLLMFSKIAKIPTEGIEPSLFYLSGITIWNYFSNCLMHTATTFTINASLFEKVYFPRLVIPISVVLSNMAKMAIQFGILILLMLYYFIFNGTSFALSWSWFLLPLMILVMAGLGLGSGLLVASLSIKYRDIGVVITFAVQLLMFATPVAYPLSMVSNRKIAEIIAWNPLSGVIEGFRYALFQHTTFDVNAFLYSLTFMVVILLMGTWLFVRVERTFADTV